MERQSTTGSAFDDKQWAMICHLGALGGFLFPFGNVIIPAVIWSMKKLCGWNFMHCIDRVPFVVGFVLDPGYLHNSSNDYSGQRRVLQLSHNN
jgi:hypothetical protein